MDANFMLPKTSWDAQLAALLEEYDLFAPFRYGDHIEYSVVTKNSLGRIIYNQAKPSSPLKTFFLPIKENVVRHSTSDKKRIILGAPACDLSALSILDEIYLDKDYVDPFYSMRRENTVLIGFSCLNTLEHCHCTTYGFGPMPGENADLVLSLMDDNVHIQVCSEKGEKLRESIGGEPATKEDMAKLETTMKEVESELKKHNKGIPDYQDTGQLVTESDQDTWKKYSDDCVSCGACSAICPTCSCFLFIERPEFEKVRSLDTCQYPGFERVAAGEDPLRFLSQRFRNRYMCKYVWKPEKFESKACTGCGRCIEACIGEINKNELFRELKSKETVKA